MKTTFNKTLKNCHFCKLIQGNHKGLGKILGFYEATNFLQKYYIFVVILVSYINVANLKEEIVTSRSFRVVSRFCTFSEKVMSAKFSKTDRPRKFVSPTFLKIGYPRKCMSTKFRPSTKVFVREIQKTFQIYNFSPYFEVTQCKKNHLKYICRIILSEKFTLP